MIDNQTKQAVADSLKLLGENNSSIRIEAVRKLGMIGITHPQIIERLRSVASNDPSPDVRNAANHSLELLQSVPADNKPQTNLAQMQSGNLNQENEKSILELIQKQNEILENLRTLIFHSTEAQNEKEYRLRTRIVDIDISISSMVNLMLKWVIASIPAAIIIGVVVFFFMTVLGGCVASLGSLGQ